MRVNMPLNVIHQATLLKFFSESNNPLTSLQIVKISGSPAGYKMSDRLRAMCNSGLLKITNPESDASTRNIYAITDFGTTYLERNLDKVQEHSDYANPVVDSGFNASGDLFTMSNAGLGSLGAVLQETQQMTNTLYKINNILSNLLEGMESDES